MKRTGLWVVLVVTSAMAGLVFLDSPGEAPLSPAVTARTDGCEICRKMAESLPAGEFAHDPHTFACRVCHHPHTQKTVDEWRTTCTSSGCHPRAWTYTVFHRVSANVFVNCTNCHGVHSWTLEGKNCLDCHGSFVDSSRAIPVTQVAGVSTFNHAPHRNLDCALCHGFERRHGEVRLRSSADCAACHHQGRSATPCETCHAKRTLAFSRTEAVQVALSVWDAPKTRDLPFPHARHSGLPCNSCHAKGGERAQADCAKCHEAHHAAGTQCTICHAAPPADAHDADVHEAECTDCHAKGPQRSKPDTRAFCLTCHRGQVDHNPGKICADCHKVSSGS
jgi:class III cytochrome C family protein